MLRMDASAGRQAFVAGQIEALEALDFVLVGVPRPPFDAVRVERDEAGRLVVAVGARAAEVPFTEEQAGRLVALGFAIDGGSESWVGPPPSSAADAASLIEQVLAGVFGVEAVTPVDVRHGSRREEVEAERKVSAMRVEIEPVLESILGKPAPRDDDDDYIVDVGDVRVFVAPRALPMRPPIVRVFAITNAGVNLTAELGLFLARLNFSLMFGRFSIDTDHQAVWFDETLLGDHVTPEELRFTVEMVASTAGEWDEKIAGMFGGRIREPQPAVEDMPAMASKPGQGGYL